jgi:hypothetical protein
MTSRLGIPASNNPQSRSCPCGPKCRHTTRQLVPGIVVYRHLGLPPGGGLRCRRAAPLRHCADDPSTDDSQHVGCVHWRAMPGRYYGSVTIGTHCLTVSSKRRLLTAVVRFPRAFVACWSLAVVAVLFGCGGSPSSAGIFAGPVTGSVLPSHTNCLYVGRGHASGFGGSDNKSLGRGVVCFVRAIGRPNACLKVEAHTPGSEVGNELRFPVDSVGPGSLKTCSALPSIVTH